MKIDNWKTLMDEDLTVSVNDDGRILIEKLGASMWAAKAVLELNIFELEKVVRFVEAQHIISQALEGGKYGSEGY